MSNESGTIEVRIRPASEAEPVHLTRWSIKDLNGLIKELNLWGYLLPDGNTYSSACGQIITGDGDAYFEVVVNDDDD